METMHFKIDGVTCEACVKIISRRFQKINGVINVIIHLDGSADITVDRLIDKNEFKNTLVGTHYVVL